jgi:hypothetical protein
MSRSFRKFRTLHTATKYKRGLPFFRGEKIWVGLFIEPQHFFLCFFFYFSVCVFCCAKQLQLESMFFVLSFFFLSTAPRAMHRSSVPFTFKRSRANVQGCQMVCFWAKYPNLERIFGAPNWKMLVYLMALLWMFGIYIFPVLVLGTKKNLATLRAWKGHICAWWNGFG